MFKLILLDIFLSIFSIIPEWNLKNFATDLLGSSTSTSYVITSRLMYGLRARLEKTITKEGETITHKNKLYFEDSDTSNKKECDGVNFENIESLYKLNKRLLCAMGKHHPIDLDDSCKEINNEKNDENNSEKEWDLKCYLH